MSNRFSKLAGWSVAALAVFVYTAQPFPPPCNGKKPSSPEPCIEGDPCEGHSQPCPAHGTYPYSVSKRCEDGVSSDHCVNAAATTAGPCQGKYNCAIRSNCVPKDPMGCERGTDDTTICTETPHKTTQSCTVP
jgi:hypothetical protein